jgi:hypothetical protein
VAGNAPVASALLVATRKLVRSPKMLVLAAAGKASAARQAAAARRPVWRPVRCKGFDMVAGLVWASKG